MKYISDRTILNMIKDYISGVSIYDLCIVYGVQLVNTYLDLLKTCNQEVFERGLLND